jgi:hypothetical protein
MEDLKGGRVESVILPRSFATLGWGGLWTKHPSLFLGWSYCGSNISTWPKPGRGGPIYVWITALFADGTESPTPAEPVKLESPEVEAFYRKHYGTGAR